MPATAKMPAKRAVTPAPGLNRLGNVKINAPAAAPKKGDIPIVQVEGDTCKRFNEAKQQIKDAEAVIKELEGVVIQSAMQHIFSHNCAPDCLAPIASVKLQDVTYEEDDEKKENPISGEVTRVSFTSKYNSNDAEQVDAAFANFKPVPDGKGGLMMRDINKYVVETVAAKFDDKVFLDAEGNFDPVVYKKFVTAMERVAKEVGLVDAEGKVRSPLGTRKVLKVKEDFHQLRFRDFDAEENFTLAGVLPNTIQCVPVRTT